MRPLFLRCLILLGLASAASAQTTYEYTRAATEQGDLPLLLDFYPGGESCTAPRPTVIYIHGGGFRSGSRRAAVNKGIAQDFSAAGINLVSISYRLHGDNPVPGQAYLTMLSNAWDVSAQENYPGQVRNAIAAFEDATAALHYIVANAARIA